MLQAPNLGKCYTFQSSELEQLRPSVTLGLEFSSAMCTVLSSLTIDLL